MAILVGTASWTDKSLIGCGRFYAMHVHTGHQTWPTVLSKDIQIALAAIPALATKMFHYRAKLPAEIRQELWRRFLGTLVPLQHAGKLKAMHFQYVPWVLCNRKRHTH